jgi:hypothetical protein
MNTSQKKYSLKLAATFIGASSHMMTFGSQTLTPAEENTIYIIDNWMGLSRDPVSDTESRLEHAINRGGLIDLNCKNNDGNTLMHIAARDGDLSAVELLVRKGAPLLERNHSGQTPLDLAREGRNGLQEIINTYTGNRRAKITSSYYLRLIDGMEEYNKIIQYLESQSRDCRSNTIRIIDNWARLIGGEGKFEPRLRSDISNGLIDLNCKNDDGNTLLHVATRYGNLPAVQLLVEQGASFTERNHSKKTPLDLAREGLDEAREGLDEARKAVNDCRKKKILTPQQIIENFHKYRKLVQYLESLPRV